MVRLLESWSVCPGAGRHMVWDSMVPGAGFVRMEGLSVAVREPWGYVPIVTTPPILQRRELRQLGNRLAFSLVSGRRLRTRRWGEARSG